MLKYWASKSGMEYRCLVFPAPDCSGQPVIQMYNLNASCLMKCPSASINKHTYKPPFPPASDCSWQPVIQMHKCIIWMPHAKWKCPRALINKHIKPYPPFSPAAGFRIAWGSCWWGSSRPAPASTSPTWPTFSLCTARTWTVGHNVLKH